MIPMDFGILSMTELRSKPGEILDRVADRGEAFIIERNGSRQACLVPFSVFFPDVSHTRIALEIDELIANAIEPRPMITSNCEIAFRLSLPIKEGQVAVTVILPHGYPHMPPKVFADQLSEDSPHRWHDGALCLYGMMSAWNPGKHTVHSTLTLVERWLQHYDVWQRTGDWPKYGVTGNG